MLWGIWNEMIKKHKNLICLKLKNSIPWIDFWWCLCCGWLPTRGNNVEFHTAPGNQIFFKWLRTTRETSYHNESTLFFVFESITRTTRKKWRENIVKKIFHTHPSVFASRVQPRKLPAAAREKGFDKSIWAGRSETGSSLWRRFTPVHAHLMSLEF